MKLLSILLFLFSFDCYAKTEIQTQIQTEIKLWHAMDGDLGRALEKLVATYNSSQEQYKVNPIFKGNYTETLNGAVAAYRGGKQPDLVQVFEVGTMTMMSSGAIIPVQDLMTENGFKINWKNFIQPVLSYYRDSNKRLMSMPFNSSTAIMYYNKDLFKKANLSQPPKTWQEVYKDIDLLLKAGAQCGLVSGWQSWVLIENFSAIQNIPIATLSNGYDGNNPDLKFNNSLVIKNIEALQNLMKTKGFDYEGRRSDPARNAFVSGKCAIYLDSSSNIEQVKAGAKFSWTTAPLPFLESTQPKNSIIGGATLWAFKGHTKEENKATADFINYLAKTESQISWHKATGYLPTTMSAYKKLKKDGYYKQYPEQEVALLQLTRTATTPNSRGIRLGGFTQIREIIEEELEKVWSGKSTAKMALDSAVERGNRVIQNFSKTVK